jgi:hypothetical protein
MAAAFLDLPNELILQTLTILPTTALLPLASISRRVHALVIRIFQTRLRQAANLPDHSLLLECYHPSQKLTEPPLFCTYVGSPGLDIGASHKKTIDDKEWTAVGSRDAMRNLYSVFTPHRRFVSKRPHPAGDIPGSRTHSSSQASTTNSGFIEKETVKQILSLEGHELFTQICAVAIIVRSGPRNGLFRSCVELEDGVIRVWREWLGRMSGEADEASITSTPSEIDLDITGKGKGKGPQLSENETGGIGEDRRILWVDAKKNVGLRLKVTEKKWRRNEPVLIHADEEDSVSYEIEYQGNFYIPLLQSSPN